MKVFKWMATAMFAFFFLSANAVNTTNLPDNEDRLLLYINSVEGKSFVLQLANLQKETTNVLIEDLSHKETLYYRRLKNHNGFSTKMNLKDLTEGRYKISIKQGDLEIIKVFRVENDELIFSNTVIR
ncbi:MAG: hypothetical protein DHS20C18_45990 [Saprospiraceae bacterium]|nr:MAG: hypothetical protein DHS20C18_45990 [Saprospiraceae bacterium]